MRGTSLSATDSAILSWSGVDVDLGPAGRLLLPDGHLSVGDVLVLLGPSGCGKSTLLSVLLGEVVVSGAEVSIGGRPLQGIPPTERPDLYAVLRQENGLLPDEGALTNCLVGRYWEDSPLDRAKTRLRQLGIREDHWDVPASRLSGGQKRRVALARALILDRPVRVFDEPTAGLDPGSVREVAHLLGESGPWEGSCGIVVTHDEELAAGVGTLVGRIAEGEVVIERVREPRAGGAMLRPPPGPRTTEIFYGPGWVFRSETRRLVRVVAPLLVVASYIIGATLLAQSLGFADVPFTRFVDMPRTILATVLRGLTLEVVPLVVGLLYAGIGGAAIAGKSATLATTGVEDTFRWLGRRPGQLFGAPAVVASVVYLPLIQVFCASAAVLGAGTVLVLGTLPLGGAALGSALRSALAGRELATLFTLVRSGIFGLLVALIGFTVGSRARGGAEAIARAAAMSVLIASLAVVVANAILTFVT